MEWTSRSRNNSISRAIVAPDDRGAFNELREIAIGFIGVRLHVLVYTRRDDVVRVISLRKAAAQEVKSYERVAS
jgi:uncharacterized protein